VKYLAANPAANMEVVLVKIQLAAD
jgi:hypothetical protein